MFLDDNFLSKFKLIVRQFTSDIKSYWDSYFNEVYSTTEPSEGSKSINTRSVLYGTNSSDAPTKISSTEEGYLEIAVNEPHVDNGTFDAFYRKRFSQPQTLFDSKQLADKQPLFWDDQLISGSGGASTYNTNQASTTLSVSNNTAAVRVRQTFRRFNYQPGKSMLFIQTGVFGTAATGIKRKAGFFDDKNGIFFDQDSSGMGVTIRTYTSGSAVDNRIAQANWIHYVWNDYYTNGKCTHKDQYERLEAISAVDIISVGGDECVEIMNNQDFSVFLSHTTSNRFYQVDTVNGAAPTSLTDLRDKILALL